MKSLKPIIAKIQKEIDNEICEINAGGCGWFAFMMYNELKKYNIKSSLVILDRGDITSKKDILNDIINNGYVKQYARDTSFNHCCVKVGKMNFDGVAFSAIQEWGGRGYKNRGEYTEKEMEIALRYGGWNSDYDKKQNSTLKNIIKKHLKPLAINKNQLELAI